MQCKEREFGRLTDGRSVRLFSFECSDGMQLEITNYGGIITSVRLSDKNGIFDELCCGFPDLSNYLKPHPYFGALVGRYAGRIGGGRLPVGDEVYQLQLHDKHCHLHGGNTGFHTRLWSALLESDDTKAVLKLTYMSPHLEENYPGNLNVTATYTIFDNNRIDLCFEAETDRPTHLNLTNHAYFNLNGFRSSVGDHWLKVDADQVVELNEAMLPTGMLKPVKGSIFDFSELILLSSRLVPQTHELDHCFVLNQSRKDTPAVELFHNETGRSLKVYTDQPGVQVYSGNFLDGSLTGNDSKTYHKHGAICFETQHFADSPNQPSFPSTLLQPGQAFRASTTYLFEVRS